MKVLELIEDHEDPRMQGKVKHKLCSVIFVTLCAVLSGCDTWAEIEDYCRFNLKWLSKQVALLGGVPSEWTFRRVFTLLDPNFIEQLLRTHASEIVSKNKSTDQIAIDGKTLCGSGTKELKNIHSVSAWCHENGLVLGEEQVCEKSNEITAIPTLIESLDIKGATITIDAAGCQKAIVGTIREKKGHYVLGLKKNQKKIYEAAQDIIKKEGEHDNNRLSDYFEKTHGRLVRRRYFGYNVSTVDLLKGWDGAKSVVAVETITSKVNDAESNVAAEWRYYLTSHDCNNKQLPNYIKNHWGIENKLHWVLDVCMKEDDDQKSERKSARSFAILKRIALNIVRTRDKTPKLSVRRKLRRCAMNNDYLISLLS